MPALFFGWSPTRDSRPFFFPAENRTQGLTPAKPTVQLFQDGQFVKYTLKAVPGQGDAAGAASQFVLVDAALCDALCQDEMSGRLQVTIDGKPYTGTIEHDSHEGHDHEGHEGDGGDHEGHDDDGGDHEGHDDDDGHDH